MFNGKNNMEKERGPVSISIISEDAIIKGNIECIGDIRIDGKLVGNVQCQSKIILGEHGVVEGDLIGQHADILGKVIGNVRMSGQLNLNGQSSIHGDIHVAKLKIESTATFNGSCTMGGHSITEIKQIAELSNA
jgi:cytoskeletal protein CcmA (bactofilin family)